MPETTDTRGVIYVATGAAYVTDACASARTLREASPGIEIDLYCDAADGVEDGLFDKIHIIENPHKRSKVDYIWQTRFDRALFLDNDTRIVADISNLFDLLDRFDLCLAHAHSRERPSTNQTWRTEIPSCFPQLNSGVFLFRRSEAVVAMFREWADAYHANDFTRDQVTLRELIWLSDLRLFVLPPEYNIRYPKYLEVWDDNEAHPKILHYPEFTSGRTGKLRHAWNKLRGRKD
ncbi:putative nucleotide-diphospho-sugar transferase [Roseibacterium beibuensis]|uniref:Nucleotide-diphospho-sugar transferase domain-containing protein n=1 Tax=[Roseibacterium] beibuensis TaxID=1193142 RepID=A0ABP9L1K8_9RHOB|nr:putative nucleotide-diphospho-sugar transferase [Roseibacterium beibuensis]MCS6621748.1 putative nucleotide-diphospho-sugar transferase [Roseibacterium beibuensis]